MQTVVFHNTLLWFIILLRYPPGHSFSMFNNKNDSECMLPSTSYGIMVDDTGFYFTESGEFLDESNSKFVFAVSDSHNENQARYEKIGDAVTEYIYKLMEEKFQLERIRIPVEIESSEPASFVFASANFRESKKNKLVLINGSGAVRAGQWARSIIVNNNLYSGSMLPYIGWAKDNDFDILVLNTNESGSKMKGSEDPFDHAQTVWNNFLNGIHQKCVYIVAHSFGGVVVQKLIKKNLNFDEIVSKIAFTDSVHMGKVGSETTPCINWVTSSKPVDTYLGGGIGASKRSAGCRDHPWTSHFAMDSIFSWFMEDTANLNDIETTENFAKSSNPEEVRGIEKTENFVESSLDEVETIQKQGEPMSQTEPMTPTEPT